MLDDYKKGVELIKSFEGIEDGNPKTVNLDPYLCPAGRWTIGWGHVVLDKNGCQIIGASNKQAAYRVYPKGITLREAEELLQEDAGKTVVAIEKYVNVELNNNQKSALLSFVYNIGVGNLLSSTLLKLLNQGKYLLVPGQIQRWNKVNGSVSKGLVRRRAAEANLWSSDVLY